MNVFMRRCVLSIYTVVTVLFFNCQYVDFVGVKHTQFVLPKGNQVKYQLSKRYFILHALDTARLSGSSICTLLVNGTIARIDSTASYLRIITEKPAVISLQDTQHYLYKQHYQLANKEEDLDASTVTRYLGFKDSGIVQLAFQDAEGMHYLQQFQRKVVPRTIEMGSFDTINSPNNNWEASPLILSHVFVQKKTELFRGRSVATQALGMTGDEYLTINGISYADGVAIKSFYCLNDEQQVDKETIIRSTVSVTVTDKYFKERGLVQQIIYLYVQKNYSGKKVEIMKQHYLHQRGPEGAKAYPDFDESDSVYLAHDSAQ